MLDLIRRPRRNRKSQVIRHLVQETHLHTSQLVAPLFLKDGKREKEIIHSMPGVFRHSIETLLQEIEELLTIGVQAFDLFPVVEEHLKKEMGEEILNPHFFIYQAIRTIKKTFPEATLMIDLALDPYTTHGHDGVIDVNGEVKNDETVRILGGAAILSAEAGIDVVAPSDMMDGRVGYIRELLDAARFEHVSILSYAAKYASAFYGPFREALHSAPKFGNKKGYQMNPANVREALMECALDEMEGADFLLIKPALAYLDVIAKVREQSDLPIAAYHVSGEYSMLLAAEQNGWIDGDAALYESLLSIKRAGADFIFTYGAKKVAKYLKAGS